MKKISSVSLAICLGLGISSPSQSGSLRDFTDTVYSSFTTSGGPENFRSTSGKSVFTGGAYSLRFNVDDIKLVDFEPPSVSASCSGIDFFAGSIGFASRDEVIQLGRNIAAAATVYGFKLALNSVCPSCNAIMQNIQSWVETINKLASASCEDALKLMEEVKDYEKPPTDGTWRALYMDFEGWDDPEKALGQDADKTFLAQMFKAGVEIADAVKGAPETIPDITDIGFFVAYNTNLWQYLFPFYDEDLARSSVWAVMTSGKSCVDEKSETADGAFCGLPNSEWSHRYSEFFHGNQLGGSNVETLKVPYCDSSAIRTIKTTQSGSFKICDYTNQTASKSVKQYSRSAPAMRVQLLKDIFGENGVDRIGNLRSEVVCINESEINIGIDSMFKRSLTFSNTSNTTFTDSQAYAASILGTNFSRDLWRMDAKGEVVTNIYERTGCGALADLVYKRANSVINLIEHNAIQQLSMAQRKYAAQPKLKNVHVKINAAIERLRYQMLNDVQVRLSAASQAEKASRKGED